MTEQLQIAQARIARFERRGILAIVPEAYGLEVEEHGGSARGFTEEGDAAVVTIRGPLLSRAEGFLALFCDDYESIRGRVEAAFASAARRVILRIDSPGGDAGGCFEFARELRAMATASGKPLVAYGESMCASAAYAIAAAATELVVAPTCYAGSIGVYETRLDLTGAARAAGAVVSIISSGEEKTDRNLDTVLTDEARARIQAQVDQYAGLFFDLVAELRGGPPDAYRAMQGGVFLGAAALGAGLADRVGGWKDVLAGSPEAETTPMANSKKSFDAAKEALRAVVDDEKCSEEEREKARKSLRSLEAEPEKKDGEKKDGEGEGEGRAAEEPPAEEKKEERAAAARASVSAPASLTRRDVEAMLDSRAKADAESLERRQLLDGRADLDATVRASLAKLPVADLRVALDGIPKKASGGALRPAAAAGTMPSVVGESQGELGYQVDGETERFLNKRMGTDGRSAPTNPDAMVFGSFDRDRAAKHLEKIGKEAT